MQRVDGDDRGHGELRVGKRVMAQATFKVIWPALKRPAATTVCACCSALTAQRQAVGAPPN